MHHLFDTLNLYNLNKMHRMIPFLFHNRYNIDWTIFITRLNESFYYIKIVYIIK